MKISYLVPASRSEGSGDIFARVVMDRPERKDNYFEGESKIKTTEILSSYRFSVNE